MSGKGFVIPPTAALEYRYDGSWSGFLCCVHESVYAYEHPLSILSNDTADLSLYRQKYIETNPEKAHRVLCSIPQKVSKRALKLLQVCFLSCLPEKEVLMLHFLLLAYQEGADLAFQLGRAEVYPLLKAERHLLNEAHLLKGFVRFSEKNGWLISTITPKNFVLPFLSSHFSSRLPQETFLIFDKTHHVALVHEKNSTRLLAIESLTIDEDTEDDYQYLWKLFYQAVSVEGRRNERCRQSHMPKRYWENMPEVSSLLTS